MRSFSSGRKPLTAAAYICPTCTLRALVGYSRPPICNTWQVLANVGRRCSFAALQRSWMWIGFVNITAVVCACVECPTCVYAAYSSAGLWVHGAHACIVDGGALGQGASTPCPVREPAKTSVDEREFRPLPQAHKGRESPGVRHISRARTQMPRHLPPSRTISLWETLPNPFRTCLASKS